MSYFQSLSAIFIAEIYSVVNFYPKEKGLGILVEANLFFTHNEMEGMVFSVFTF
jgi:hypothetical protein